MEYGTSVPQYESTAQLPFGSPTVIGSARSGGFTEYGYAFTPFSP